MRFKRGLLIPKKKKKIGKIQLFYETVELFQKNMLLTCFRSRAGSLKEKTRFTNLKKVKRFCFEVGHSFGCIGTGMKGIV